MTNTKKSVYQNTYKIIGIYLVMISFLLSCRSGNEALIEFGPESLNGTSITLSDIAEDITYVSIDKSITVGSINPNFNPLVIDNTIYLFDRENGIMAFNRKGELIKTIGNIGRGPGEYIRGNKFAVDDKTRKIYICDVGNIIKVYSGSGSFQRSMSLQNYGGSVDAVGLIDSKLFVTYNMQYDDAEFEWVLIDSMGNLIMNKRRTGAIFSSNYLAGGGTYIVGSKLNYWSNFIDTVFSISDDFTINPEFLIKPGDYRLPKSKVEDPLSQLSEFMTIDQIFESKRFIAIRYSFYKGRDGFVLIDKNSRQTYSFNWNHSKQGGMENDLDGGLAFLPKGYYVENDEEYFVSLLDPVQLKNHVSSVRFKDSKPELKDKKKEVEKLAGTLCETDNTIVVIVRLKK